MELWSYKARTFIRNLLVGALEAQHQVHQAVNDLHEAAGHLLAAAPRRAGVLVALVPPVPRGAPRFAWILAWIPATWVSSRRAACTYT